jgi:hypothetical protein
LLIAQGMTLAVAWPTVAGVPFLYCLSIIYRYRSAKLATVSLLATQLVAFSYVGAILTYLAMAATSQPMADGMLAQADAALGFDWFSWFGFVNAHSKLKLLFALAYNSWPAQGLVLLGYQSVAELASAGVPACRNAIDYFHHAADDAVVGSGTSYCLG